MNLETHLPQAKLEARLRFETLLSELTARFVNLAPADVDGEIDAALHHLCEGLGLDRSTLWEFPTDDAPEGAQLVHYYQISEAPPIPHIADAASLFPWTNACANRGEEVVFTRRDELPQEAARDRESYRMYGTLSAVVLPLQTAGKRIGILSFATTRNERTWTDHTLRRCRLCAQVFAAVIDRRRSDMALHESEERLRLATDAAEAGLWSLEIETMQFWGSPRLRELLGIAPGAELTYAVFLDTVYGPDREAVRRSIRDASQDGALLAADFRIGLPDGKLRWVTARGRLGHGPSHRSLIGLCVDATERKASEEALHDLSQRLIRAHEEERRRLARELHDDLSQRLALLSIDLGELQDNPDANAAPQIVQSVCDGLARLSEDVHAIAYVLHPTVLEDLGLVAAVRAECDRFARRESIAIEMSFGEVPDEVPQEVALCLFRVTQEALRNASRHAEASKIEVSLQERDGGLRLAVSDDGVGFDPASLNKGAHLGLASMQERVNLVCGALDIHSAPGEGTTVTVWVPLQEIAP